MEPQSEKTAWVRIRLLEDYQSQVLGTSQLLQDGHSQSLRLEGLPNQPFKRHNSQVEFICSHAVAVTHWSIYM